MFKVHHHINYAKATVTLLGTGATITTHNSEQAIKNAAGYLLRQYLLNYLKFRYETYMRIGHPKTMSISLAYTKVLSLGNDLNKLVHWSKNNTEFLHQILPSKRKTHYNESLNTILPR